MQHSIDKKELANVFKNAIADLISVPPKIGELYLLRTTSGTTGTGPLNIVYDVTAEGFERSKGVERLLVAAGPLSQRLSNVLHVRYGSEEGQRVLCIEPTDIGANLAPILADYMPDMVYGMCSLVVFLATSLNRMLFKTVRSLIITGEYLTAPVKALLIGHFPNATLFQMYASAETNQVSKLFCPHLPSNAYHILPAVEVAVDMPDEKGIGSILLGRHLLRGIRMDRYHIGDSGKIVSEACACGEQATLYLAGRSGFDYIKLAGAILRKEEFDRVAALHGAFISEYTAEAFTTGETGRLLGGIVLKVFRSTGPLTPQEKELLVKDFSADLFVTPTQTLEDLVRKGLFVPLAVESVSEPFVRKGKEITLFMRAS